MCSLTKEMKHGVKKQQNFLFNYKVEERLNESAARVHDKLIDEFNEAIHDTIKDFC